MLVGKAGTKVQNAGTKIPPVEPSAEPLRLNPFDGNHSILKLNSVQFSS
jgi:hypothetical protein